MAGSNFSWDDSSLDLCISDLDRSTTSTTIGSLPSPKDGGITSEVTPTSTDASQTSLTGMGRRVARDGGDGGSYGTDGGEPVAAAAAALGTWGDCHQEQQITLAVKHSGCCESPANCVSDLDLSEETTISSLKTLELKTASESIDSQGPTLVCNLNSANTRSLLLHYLDATESVDNFKISQFHPSYFINILYRQFVDFCQFIFVILSSRLFWNACLMIINVLAAVFFYLVIAVSAIFITIIITLHDALVQRNDDVTESEEDNKMQINTIRNEFKVVPCKSSESSKSIK